jgi:methionyl-tRNA formyltransferase
LRVLYFGMPLGALLLEQDGHDLVYAGISREGALGLRRLRRRLGDRVRVRPEPSSPVALARLAALEPDLVVSWFWTKRLPREVLGLGRLGAIGVHPSLLPRHRGPDPYFWAIDAGDAETGVTAHLLDERYDTGAVLAARALRVDPSWDAWTLAKKLDRPSLALLREVVAAYARGEPPTPQTQDESRATEAPAPTEDMLEIRWSDPAEAIARRIRAAAPWPGAFTEIGGETVVIVRARPTRDFPRALEPGEGAVRADGVGVVRAGDEALELLSGRREADEAELDGAALAELITTSH